MQVTYTRHQSTIVEGLKAAVSNPLLDTYIEEAEHQDGNEYWDNFETVADAVEDFNLFVEASE